MRIMKLRLFLVGKTRRPELRALFDDYLNRIRHHAPIEAIELRDAATVLKRLDAARSATVVLLDAGGKHYTSQEFAAWLGAERLRGARELIFLCGDAEGFPESIHQCAQHKLSLSAMTFSHELARVVLAEQLYRAFAILSGSPYPK